MNSPIATGLFAGLASGALFLSIATGSPLAVLCYLLAPLPVFIAGLGWGPASGLVAAVAAAATLLPIGGPSFALAHVAIVGAPVTLMLVVAVSGGGETTPAAAPSDPPAQGYALPRLLALTIGLAGLFAALNILLLGADIDTYRTSIKDLFGGLVKEISDKLPGQIPPEAQLALVRQTETTLPGIAAFSWIILMHGNLWLAGRVARTSGRLSRPWPDLARLELPQPLALTFIASIAASYAGGMPGLLASGFAAAHTIVYAIAGVAILHSLTRGLGVLRPVLLGLAYVLLVVVTKPVAVGLVTLALVEPILGLRARRIARLAAGRPN